MSLKWFKKRGYRHFDNPVGQDFAAKVPIPGFVTRNSFLPLIHYTKTEPRYRKSATTGKREITVKERPIKFASHRDACILTYYAHILNERLDGFYKANGLSDSVLAYRALGRGNYHFAADALAFSQKHAPVTILAFDISGFFDHLDHGLLKQRLKSVLGVTSLPEDWYRVFRFVTDFHYVDLVELKKHPAFSGRFKERTRNRIASVEELKTEGITFHPNPELANGRKRGIPQGTPISAVASNAYMIDFDLAARTYCDGIGALCRRYSDDILVVCDVKDADAVETKISTLISAEKLEISKHKTERVEFAGHSAPVKGTKAAQYLGFTFHEAGPAIRESSLARQWRKLRRAIKRTKKVAKRQIAAGKAKKAFTKKLVKRFSYLTVYDGEGVRAVRNFSSYGRRSAAAFDQGERIRRQVKRFERAARREISDLQKL